MVATGSGNTAYLCRSAEFFRNCGGKFDSGVWRYFTTENSSYKDNIEIPAFLFEEVSPN